MSELCLRCGKLILLHLVLLSCTQVFASGSSWDEEKYANEWKVDEPTPAQLGELLL